MWSSDKDNFLEVFVKEGRELLERDTFLTNILFVSREERLKELHALLGVQLVL